MTAATFFEQDVPDRGRNEPYRTELLLLGRQTDETSHWTPGQTSGRRICHLDRRPRSTSASGRPSTICALPTTDRTQDGYAIYQLFTTVIILNHIERQNGQSRSDADFRSLLRLRSGEITEDDWRLLLSGSPNKANNSHLFDTAVRLFYDRLTVFQYNQDRLKALGRPIARINAIHSSPTAAAAQADDAGGLEPVLYLSEGAPVMLTRNLYSEAGLCNDTPGTVVSILRCHQRFQRCWNTFSLRDFVLHCHLASSSLGLSRAMGVLNALLC